MGRQPWVVQGLLLTQERRLADRRPVVGRPHARRLHRCSTASSPSSKDWLMIRCRAGWARAGRHIPRLRGRQPDDAAGPDLLMLATTANHGYWNLQSFWFAPDRDPLDRLLRPRGLRLRGRHSAAFHRPQRRGARHAGAYDRPRLGRERGLADRGRRGDLRRVPRVVRDTVLRLLHPALLSCSSV